MLGALLSALLVSLLFGIYCGRAQRIAFPELTSVIIGGAVCYKVHTLLLQSDADMLGAGPSE